MDVGLKSGWSNLHAIAIACRCEFHVCVCSRQAKVLRLCCSAALLFRWHWVNLSPSTFSRLTNISALNLCALAMAKRTLSYPSAFPLCNMTYAQFMRPLKQSALWVLRLSEQCIDGHQHSCCEFPTDCVNSHFIQICWSILKQSIRFTNKQNNWKQTKQLIRFTSRMPNKSCCDWQSPLLNAI